MTAIATLKTHPARKTIKERREAKRTASTQNRTRDPMNYIMSDIPVQNCALFTYFALQVRRVAAAPWRRLTQKRLYEILFEPRDATTLNALHMSATFPQHYIRQLAELQLCILVGLSGPLS